MSPPIVHIKDIPSEGLDLDLALDAAWLRSALADTGIEAVGNPPGRAHLRMHLTGDAVILSGVVDATLQMQCVRCLESVTVPVHTTFTLNLEPAPKASRHRGAPRDEVELTADELDVDFYENDRVDVGHWVREQILIEAPSFPSCPAGCAAPLAVPAAPADSEPLDPRLAPLKKLSNKE